MIPGGRLLGAQALGEDNVDKRISALATAIQMGATIYDLEEAELCYAKRVLLQHGFKARNLSGGFLSRAILSEGFADAAITANR